MTDEDLDEDLAEDLPEEGRFRITFTRHYDVHYWTHDGDWKRDSSKARVFTSRNLARLYMKKASHQPCSGVKVGRKVVLENLEGL